MIDICKSCFEVMEHMIRGACGLPVVNDAGVVSRVGQGRVLLPQCPAMDQHLRKEDAIRPPAHNVQYQSLCIIWKFYVTKSFMGFKRNLYFSVFSASQCQRCTNVKNNGECNKQKIEICSADQVAHSLTQLSKIYTKMLFVAYLIAKTVAVLPWFFFFENIQYMQILFAITIEQQNMTRFLHSLVKRKLIVEQKL